MPPTRVVLSARIGPGAPMCVHQLPTRHGRCFTTNERMPTGLGTSSTDFLRSDNLLCSGGEDGDPSWRQGARDKQQILDIGLAEPGKAHGRPSCPRPRGARHDVGPLPQVETPGAQVADTLQKLPRTPGAARSRLVVQGNPRDSCPSLAREL